jgi:multiple sugar transport system permease protein
MLLPYYFMLVTSLKSYPEMFNIKDYSPFWPAKPTLDHYKQLFTETSFLIWFKNSAIVASITTAISVAISTLAGYSLARLRFRANRPISLGIFVAYLVPQTLLFIPVVQVAGWLGVIGKQIALFVFYPTLMIPFATWVLMAYFQTIPPDLEECAMVDGATRLQALRKVTLPLAMPGIVTVAIFSFTNAWNEFLYVLVMVYDTLDRTLPVAILSRLAIGDWYYWGPLMGASLLSGIPVVVLYSFVVDQYVSGLTAGAVKG